MVPRYFRSLISGPVISTPQSELIFVGFLISFPGCKERLLLQIHYYGHADMFLGVFTTCVQGVNMICVYQTMMHLIMKLLFLERFVRESKKIQKRA